MALYPPPADISFDLGMGRTEPDPDIMRTGRIPVEAYTSDERYERERELFGKVWLNIGRVEEIANAGDWLVFDVECRSTSVLVVRGKDMKIRAFHNICSHRGLRLAWDSKGRGGKFSCRYHAWTFEADGSLSNIPDEACFPEVDKAQNGLSPIHCDVWEGFIFINLDPNPAQTLKAFLGPVYDRLAGAPFGDYPLAVGLSQEVVGNWKLGVEAASEGYHNLALHGRTVGTMMSTEENKYTTFPVWEPLGPHRMATVPRNPDYVVPSSRLVQKFAFESAGQLLVEGYETDEQRSTGFMGHPGINRGGVEHFQIDQFWLFPNVSIDVAMNGWWWTSYWPLSRGRSKWKTVYYYKKPQDIRELFARNYAIALQRDIFTEDNACFQRQQAMLDSGGKKEIFFGEQEILLRHLMAVVSTLSKAEDTRIAAE